MTHPFDELHALVAEAYRRDDAIRFKLDAWVRKNDPRSEADRPKLVNGKLQLKPEPM